MREALTRRLVAETLGSLILAATVIGSGILASRLAGGNDAVALLGNTAATGAILFVLITALGPISGAHFNPAVTLVMALKRDLPAGEAGAYAAAQTMGCILGAWLAHYMFELPVFQTSEHVRAGLPQITSEAAATFALVFTILFVSRWRASAVPAAVALVITAGYWWTASTSFANPAITLARALSDTFAGVRPVDVPGFVAGQIAGALLAWGAAAILLPREGQA
jgi:glycerol uptake facilitator-like aquaporin